MWRAKERRESNRPHAPWCGLWAVDAAPTMICHLKGIGDLAWWPLLYWAMDGWWKPVV
jgi:hypothetical protein